MSLILLEWSDPSTFPDIGQLSNGVEIDTGIISSGNLAILTVPITGGDVYVSGQKVSLFAVSDINMKGHTVFANNRNNLAPIQIKGSIINPATTNEGDLFSSPKSNQNISIVNYDSGSGIVAFAIASGYYCAFDKIVGGDGVTIGSVATIIGFNNIRVKDSQYQSVPNNAANSGIIQVVQDGTYQISYGANFTRTAGTTSTAGIAIKSELFINGVALPGSASRDGGVNQAGVTFGMSANTITTLKAGDQITLRALKEITTAPTVRTNNNECWITVTKLR